MVDCVCVCIRIRGDSCGCEGFQAKLDVIRGIADAGSDVEAKSERVGEAVQKFWRIKEVREIERLVGEFEAGQVQSLEATNIGYFDIGC